jgi:hypothetical protein
MTLIITELSDLGIVMVGDTAQTVDSITPAGTVRDRAFYGLVKVLPIRKLQAGVSYWGWTKMPPNEREGRWLDWWLQDLMDRRYADYDTLYDFAQLLETELRRVVPPLSEDELRIMPYGSGGVHLAGFLNAGIARRPCFWHIHNGASQALWRRRIDPHIVNANYDWPSLRVSDSIRRREYPVIRNGDIEVYSRLWDEHLRAYTDQLFEEEGIIMPFPALGPRAEFWSAQIRFISALYEAGGLIEDQGVRPMIKEIGDQITTLTISSDGIRSYFTR